MERALPTVRITTELFVTFQNHFPVSEQSVDLTLIDRNELKIKELIFIKQNFQKIK